MNALKQVLAKIDPDEVVALTRDLVRIPSVYRPDDPDATEARVAAHVEAWLRREGFAVEIQDVAPGRPNVIGTLGEKRPGRRSVIRLRANRPRAAPLPVYPRPPASDRPVRAPNRKWPPGGAGWAGR